MLATEIKIKKLLAFVGLGEKFVGQIAKKKSLLELFRQAKKMGLDI